MSIRKLEAPDGYVYVCGEHSGKVVYLGKNDTKERWVLVKESDEPDISDSEALEIILGGEVR